MGLEGVFIAKAGINHIGVGLLAMADEVVDQRIGFVLVSQCLELHLQVFELGGLLGLDHQLCNECHHFVWTPC